MDSLNANRRVLLVEDEMMVAGMVRRMLADLGYSVVSTATTVAEAMEMIRSGGIDTAILDINLDGEMSYPVADELVSRGIPFVFSTGYGAVDMPDVYRSVGLLKKPFRRSGLGDALVAILEAGGSAAGVESGKASSTISTAQQSRR